MGYRAYEDHRATARQIEQLERDKARLAEEKQKLQTAVERLSAREARRGSPRHRPVAGRWQAQDDAAVRRVRPRRLRPAGQVVHHRRQRRPHRRDGDQVRPRPCRGRRPAPRAQRRAVPPPVWRRSAARAGLPDRRARRHPRRLPRRRGARPSSRVRAGPCGRTSGGSPTTRRTAPRWACASPTVRGSGARSYRPAVHDHVGSDGGLNMASEPLKGIYREAMKQRMTRAE